MSRTRPPGLFLSSILLLFIATRFGAESRAIKFYQDRDSYGAFATFDANIYFSQVVDCLELEPWNVAPAGKVVEAEGECFLLYSEAGCTGKFRRVEKTQRMDLEDFTPASVGICGHKAVSFNPNWNTNYAY